MRPKFLEVIEIVLLFVFGLAGFALAQSDNGPTSSLRFVVVRDSDGKPVRNSEIVLHPVNSKGKQGNNGEMELKTDAEGHTMKHPGGQYSVYENHDEQKKPQ